jgi:hypothetical protein
MGTRSGTTYKKRQKELARQDKQREKAAKRAQRKLQRQINATDRDTAELETAPTDAAAAEPAALPDAENAGENESTEK